MSQILLYPLKFLVGSLTQNNKANGVYPIFSKKTHHSDADKQNKTMQRALSQTNGTLAQENHPTWDNSFCNKILSLL